MIPDVAMWYKFTYSGGNTVLPGSAPGNYKEFCYGSAWLQGGHPTLASYASSSATACFDYTGNTCMWSTTIEVTNCKDFHMYHLKGVVFDTSAWPSCGSGGWRSPTTGACWYYAGSGLSCDTVCSGKSASCTIGAWPTGSDSERQAASRAIVDGVGGSCSGKSWSHSASAGPFYHSSSYCYYASETPSACSYGANYRYCACSA